MYKTTKTTPTSEAVKPDIYDYHHISPHFANHIEPRSGYVIHPEWLSEALFPNTTVYSSRRPWPYEIPHYRAFVSDHPASVCNDQDCYCKKTYQIAGVPCSAHGVPCDRCRVDPGNHDLHPEEPSYPEVRPDMFLDDPDGGAERRAQWSRQLEDIRAYNSRPEPTRKDLILRNATLQKRWLWDTFTHAVCTPGEGLLRDLQKFNIVYPGLADLPHLTLPVTK